ncbi:type II secretion system protein [Mucisphaera sp.]|uniref:type II secretion system protein n=1 Tax=Mucisphaera sp. TaxID=2913024 RepID=UPI003D0E3739
MFQSTKTPNRRSGFTLIELLVVISIIALLIGILLPALGAARNSARAMGALANARSLGQAIWLYTLDNRDHYIPYHSIGFGDWGTGLGASDPERLSPGQWWTANLVSSGYVGTPEVFTDPLLEEIGQVAPIIDAPSSSPEDFRKLYWMFPHFSMNTSNIGSMQRATGFSAYAPPSPNETAYTPRSTDVRNPSGMIAYTTAVTETGPAGNPDRRRGNIFVWDYGQPPSAVIPDARNNGSIAMVYADGHASYMALKGANIDPGESRSTTQAFRGYYGDPGSASQGGQRGGGSSGGSSGLQPDEYEGFLTDARTHVNNRWTITGQPASGIYQDPGTPFEAGETELRF